MDSTVKIYDGAVLNKTTIGRYSIIGQDTCVTDSKLESHVQLNRRNIVSESVIGDYTYTGANTIIKVAEIGKFCSISWNVSMTGNKHDYHMLASHPLAHFPSFGFTEEFYPLPKEKIIIGNDVWIGANSCVLAGVHIGDGAVIGGGAVVTKGIPPYAIVAGNPAKIIGYRFSSVVIDRLLSIRWWDWSEETIRENISFFKSDIDEKVLQQLERIAYGSSSGGIQGER